MIMQSTRSEWVSSFLTAHQHIIGYISDLQSTRKQHGEVHYTGYDFARVYSAHTVLWTPDCKRDIWTHAVCRARACVVPWGPRSLARRRRRTSAGSAGWEPAQCPPNICGRVANISDDRWCTYAAYRGSACPCDDSSWPDEIVCGRRCNWPYVHCDDQLCSHLRRPTSSHLKLHLSHLLPVHSGYVLVYCHRLADEHQILYCRLYPCLRHWQYLWLQNQPPHLVCHAQEDCTLYKTNIHVACINQSYRKLHNTVLVSNGNKSLSIQRV